MSLKDRTESVWESETLPHFDPLKNNQTADVCIIGGGVTGISVAYQLAKRGYKVILAEAFRICSGQTGRTTAHLSCQLEDQFVNLLKHHDQKTLSLFLDAHRTAIDNIEEIITENNIDCDFKRLPGYLFKGKNFDEEKLRKEQAAGKKIGIDLEYISETPLLKNKISSLRFDRQGEFNPIKYVKGLITLMAQMNVQFFENTHIHDIHRSPENVELITDEGHRIVAKKLVVATNTPINNRFHIHTKQFAYRTYAMSFQLLKKDLEPCLLWDTEDPYHYIRLVGDTLVVGGEDHRTGQGPETDPFVSIEKWTRENFDFVGDILHKWSGQIFEPADQIAYIGQNFREENVYISTGESGLGMTNAMIASMIIPACIEKASHPWAHVFNPSRTVVHGLKDFILENANVAFQYKDWMSTPQVKSVDEINRDEGCLIQEGMSKSCVYHDVDDTFEKKTAVCTHLGGIVHWNDIEKTWDCPCHGSRFNTHGQVIEGPAVSGLEGR